MKLMFKIVLLAWFTPSFADNIWSEIDTPIFTEPPLAIGSYSAGCIAGAVPLALQGKGFQVMRPSRNRYYGHPTLIAFVERLGGQAAAHGLRLLIGDLSQPRGGPMSNGHRSHQSGLDVDIWFSLGPKERYLTREETERLPMLSLVKINEGRLNTALWSPDFREILKLAAEDPKVERIFVNPIIKQALCYGERNRNWLHKIRPWWGHDEHFHVRLSCPVNSPQCREQQPLPIGDGCDEGLDQWVQEIQLAAKAPPPKKTETPKQPLPELCAALLRSSRKSLQPAALANPDS